MHPIARFARLAVANSIRQDDEEFRRIEELAGAEKFAGELRSQELRATASCAVHDENRIAGHALVIPHRFAQGAVMQPQFRQRFAGGKLEIAQREIAFVRLGIIGGVGHGRKKNREGEESGARSEIHGASISQLLLG